MYFHFSIFDSLLLISWTQVGWSWLLSSSIASQSTYKNFLLLEYLERLKSSFCKLPRVSSWWEVCTIQRHEFAIFFFFFNHKIAQRSLFRYSWNEGTFNMWTQKPLLPLSFEYMWGHYRRKLIAVLMMKCYGNLSSPHVCLWEGILCPFFLNTYVWFHGKDQDLIRMESVEIL